MNAQINLKTQRVQEPCIARLVLVTDTISAKEVSCSRDKAKKKLWCDPADFKVLSTFRFKARKEVLYNNLDPHNCLLKLASLSLFYRSGIKTQKAEVSWPKVTDT